MYDFERGRLLVSREDSHVCVMGPDRNDHNQSHEVAYDSSKVLLMTVATRGLSPPKSFLSHTMRAN